RTAFRPGWIETIFETVVVRSDYDRHLAASQRLRGFVWTQYSGSNVRRARQKVRSLASRRTRFNRNGRFVRSSVAKGDSKGKRHQHWKDEDPEHGFSLAQEFANACQRQLDEWMKRLGLRAFFLVLTDQSFVCLSHRA